MPTNATVVEYADLPISLHTPKPMKPKKPADTGFKGNKSFLPSKPCAVCAKPMSWRKAWARNWDDVKYCSTACQRQRRERAPRDAG